MILIEDSGETDEYGEPIMVNIPESISIEHIEHMQGGTCPNIWDMMIDEEAIDDWGLEQLQKEEGTHGI